MTDVLGRLHVVGRRRRASSQPETGAAGARSRSPTSCPASRCRRGLGAAPGLPARLSCTRSRCGRTSRPSRSATGCCAPRRRTTAGCAAGPTRCSRWATRRHRLARRRTRGCVAFYAALGQRPIAAGAAPGRTRGRAVPQPRLGRWRAATPTRFQLRRGRAGSARYALHASRARRPRVDGRLESTSEADRRGRPGSGTRRRGPRRRPATGSASTRHRGRRPSTAGAGWPPR